MIRWLGWVFAGIVLGGIVHLSTVLILPLTATRNGYSRLEPFAPVNTMTLLPQPTPASAVLPFLDPAFATAVCRYDLTVAPLKVVVTASQAYTSLSFYTPRGIAFYAINDRAAVRRTIELDLMTSEQRAQIQEDEEVTAADRLIVESPTPGGLLVVRGFAPEPGDMPVVRGVLSQAQCRPQPLQ
ncbi:MAG TPA: DUF1254 domain-containing protein [Xanthobacteraceae bacterium]|nr:DUF1254 domain-containing protein [Xanthobacteraceae bacterium]